MRHPRHPDRVKGQTRITEAYYEPCGQVDARRQTILQQGRWPNEMKNCAQVIRPACVTILFTRSMGSM
jgi:hypothetical protein